MTQEISVRGPHLLYHADPPPGDHEEVDGGLGRDVFEGDTLVVLVKELRWNTAVKNLVENGPRVTDVLADQSDAWTGEMRLNKSPN